MTSWSRRLPLAAADPSITRVELRGEGRAFCAGGDLDEFGSRPDPATAHLIRLQRSVGRSLARLDKPIVSPTCTAPTLGSGIELAAFTDRIVAAPDTQIALPEIGLGLVPGAGGTVSLPRRIGRLRTAWLAFSGLHHRRSPRLRRGAWSTRSPSTRQPPRRADAPPCPGPAVRGPAVPTIGEKPP